MTRMTRSVGPARAPTNALVHRKSLIGFRIACEQMWGAAGFEAICAALPADVRARTGGMVPLPEWIALDDHIAWHVAVWDGPAKGEEKIMTQHIRATIDQGFGRVKRFLLSISTAQSLAPRVVSLWREEYSTGTLQALSIQERTVQLALTDHPYGDIPLMRYVIAEAFRYILSLTRTKNVSAVHSMRGGALVVTLRWD
jgi:hypothetical protein